MIVCSVCARPRPKPSTPAEEVLRDHACECGSKGAWRVDSSTRETLAAALRDRVADARASGVSDEDVVNAIAEFLVWAKDSVRK